MIDRLARCTYAPPLTDDELARLRAHLNSPVSLSRPQADLAAEARRAKLVDILKFNDELRRTGAPVTHTGAGGTDGAPVDTPEAVHNEDFTMVRWYGTEYTFAVGVQASAVEALWKEWAKTRLGLHQDTIRKAIDTERDSFRMDTAFRNHPAWGTMIKRLGDGRYRLATPSPEPPRTR